VRLSLRAGLDFWGDITASSVDSDDLAALAQQGDGAPYRDAGDALLGGEFGFAGQSGVGGEPSGVDVSFEVGGDLDGHWRGRVMPDPAGPVLQRHDDHAR
jgi:hypothetical protein